MYWTQEVDVTADIATTPEVLVPDSAISGAVFVPNGLSMTLLTVHGCYEPGGTFEPLYAVEAAVAMVVAADRAVALPAAIFGCVAIKFVGSHAETIRICFRE